MCVQKIEMVFAGSEHGVHMHTVGAIIRKKLTRVKNFLLIVEFARRHENSSSPARVIREQIYVPEFRDQDNGSPY